MSDPVRRAMAQAIQAGILPADAVVPATEARPWPLVLLTALGAWLAAIPLIGGIGLLLEDLLAQDLGPFLVGLPMLALAAGLLRTRSLPDFVEQLTIPVLLVGLGITGFGLARELLEASAAAVLGGLCLVLAGVVPRASIRLLLGLAAAASLTWALTLALAPGHGAFTGDGQARVRAWIGLHGALVVWLLILRVQGRLPPGRAAAALAEALEPIAAGWLTAILVGLSLLSGMTLLVGAALGPVGSEMARELGAHAGIPRTPVWVPVASGLLVLAGTLWGARAWPGLRRPWILGVGVGMAALAWLLPTLGAVWLALIVTLTSARTRLAGLAALAGAWIIGSSYYQLQWTLAEKALGLAAIGLLLGVLVWLGAWLGPWLGVGRSGASGAGGRLRPAYPAIPGGAAVWLIVLAALATLAVTGLQVWHKERLIGDGRPVFVELAPVDPRSLIQGDFMRLAFSIPSGIDPPAAVLGGARPQVVASVDARGVATLLRLYEPGVPPGEGELLFELTPKDGRWTLATDAWFFREGEAERWQAARYGEFRVTPDGAALLVGLADAELRPIQPRP